MDGGRTILLVVINLSLKLSRYQYQPGSPARLLFTAVNNAVIEVRLLSLTRPTPHKAKKLPDK